MFDGISARDGLLNQMDVDVEEAIEVPEEKR